MAEEQGFTVNDHDHVAQHSRESNGWGFTREDLQRHDVQMVTNVQLVWSEDTPPEMRKVFAEASHVLHYIAEKAIMAQLAHDNLKPTQKREVLFGREEGADQPVVLRSSDWQGIE